MNKSRRMSAEERRIRIELAQARASLERRRLRRGVCELSTELQPGRIARGLFPRLSASRPSDFLLHAAGLARRYPLLLSGLSTLLPVLGRRSRLVRLGGALLLGWRLLGRRRQP